MRPLVGRWLFALCTLPAVAATQAAPSPLADALRAAEQRQEKNLVAAAEEMPAEKYGYKPTPAQMSFGDVIAHLADGNDFLCSKISGVVAPERSKIAGTAPKDQLVARLKETFTFCGSALAKVDDSKLGEQMTLFGKNPVTRATTILITVADWADHYSQVAIYLRLNDLLPPTAQRRQG